MATKTKRPLKKWGSAKPTIPLPSWIVFWSLVLSTMIIIVASFTSAVRPFMEGQVYDPAADIAQIKMELDSTVTVLETIK
jgi:TRAP-type C4-dicarboxylate transport system permease small subunit